MNSCCMDLENSRMTMFPAATVRQTLTMFTGLGRFEIIPSRYLSSAVNNMSVDEKNGRG